MANFRLKLVSIIFICYFLTSIVGGGLITTALFNTTDDGEQRCLKLSSTALIICRIFLVLYMISTAIMLILFFMKV